MIGGGPEFAGDAGRLVEPSWLASPSLSRHFGQRPFASAGIGAPHSRQLVTEVVMAVLGFCPLQKNLSAKVTRRDQKTAPGSEDAPARNASNSGRGRPGSLFTSAAAKSE